MSNGLGADEYARTEACQQRLLDDECSTEKWAGEEEPLL
jgi:hypothetical protein